MPGRKSFEEATINYTWLIIRYIQNKNNRQLSCDCVMYLIHIMINICETVN